MYVHILQQAYDAYTQPKRDPLLRVWILYLMEVYSGWLIQG